MGLPPTRGYASALRIAGAGYRNDSTRVGQTELAGPFDLPTFPHDAIPLAISHSRAHDAAEGFQSERPMGRLTDARLLFQPPLKESPALLLVEVSDRGLHRFPGVASALVRSGHVVFSLSYPVLACRRCAPPWSTRWMVISRRSAENGFSRKGSEGASCARRPGERAPADM